MPTLDLDPAFLVSRLACPGDDDGPLDIVLDTDAFNEIDDQFALVYILLCSQRFRLHAVYAAPFHNHRSSGPGEGMRRSHEEILRVLEIMGQSSVGLAHLGSERWLPDAGTSVSSAARDDLIERARRQPDGRPLYVVAIGAITNVAAALIAAPEIGEKIVVVWLGGHPLHWPTANEFNLAGDANASRCLLDSGVPLVLVPCLQVAELIKTTVAELDAHLDGVSPIGTYLARIFREYEGYDVRRPGHAKEVWDLAPLAWLGDAGWTTSVIEPSPILTGDLTWSIDASRHPIRVVKHVRRDPLFADLFQKATTH